MRVFTIINGYTGALCLQELLAQGHEVVGVVTAPGEVLAITGEGPLVQMGRGLLILTDCAVEDEKTDSLGALAKTGIPVLLG